RTALQNMLNQHNLTYVVLSDTVLITTEDLGFYRQMRQRVNVDVADKSLAEILKQLSDETGVNLVLDPRQADKAKGKIAIQLDDVTLDTALKLLTELADLSAVRVGSVVFVTSEARAEKLRKDNAPGRNPDSPYGPTVVPGFSGAMRFGPGIIP